MTLLKNCSTIPSVKKKTLQAVFFMVESMEEIVQLSLLFDFYGEMLNEHKKRIFEDYILNDYSLAEIANEEGISRQGVHDIVKRCTKQLKEYESTLHLVEKFQKMRSTLTKASELLNIEVTIESNQNIRKAQQLLEQVLQEL